MLFVILNAISNVPAILPSLTEMKSVRRKKDNIFKLKHFLISNFSIFLFFSRFFIFVVNRSDIADGDSARMLCCKVSPEALSVIRFFSASEKFFVGYTIPCWQR